jgi:hypothetical protein
MLEHSENPPQDLKKMRGALKKGGKLILVLPMERHKEVPLELSQNQHLYGWNFQTINNLLIKNGFKPIKNKVLKNAGYTRLLSLYRKSPKIYAIATHLASYLSNSKEMIIVAIKE